MSGAADRMARLHAGRAAARIRSASNPVPSRGSTPDVVRARSAYLHNVKARYESKYRRAWGGRSQKAAIGAKCVDCCCQQESEVAACTCVECPLWDYRPYKVAK